MDIVLFEVECKCATWHDATCPKLGKTNIKTLTNSRLRLIDHIFWATQIFSLFNCV